MFRGGNSSTVTTDVANAISDFGMQKVEEQLTVKFMVQDSCWSSGWCFLVCLTRSLWGELSFDGKCVIARWLVKQITSLKLNSRSSAGLNSARPKTFFSDLQNIAVTLLISKYKWNTCLLHSNQKQYIFSNKAKVQFPARYLNVRDMVITL